MKKFPAVRTGKYLRSLRKDSGYTQKEVAKALGVTESYVSRWEDDSCPFPP